MGEGMKRRLAILIAVALFIGIGLSSLSFAQGMRGMMGDQPMMGKDMMKSDMMAKGEMMEKCPMHGMMMRNDGKINNRHHRWRSDCLSRQ